MSINQVTISGNLTREPELRATNSGMNVLTFGVAVNERRKNAQTGEYENYPNFIDCTMFGKRAESVSRFIHKGLKVAIQGKLRYTQWTAQDGSKKSKVGVIVDEIDLMSQAQNQQAYSAPVPQAPAPQAPIQQTPVQHEFYTEDIPF